MVTISIDRPAEWDVCEVHCFADIHLGDKHSDGKLLIERIKRAENTENCVVILNGDLCNVATRTSVSDVFEGVKPMEQMQTVVNLFGKLAEQGKIIAITDGNHERRVYKNDGIDLSEVIATQLGIHDRYSPGAALIFLRFGARSSAMGQHRRKMMYTIFVNHGSGGGSKVGGKANRLVGMSEIVDADCFIHAHTHEPIIVKRSFFRTSPANSSVQQVDRLFVNLASYMTQYGGYAEQGEFAPSSSETPIIYLDGHNRNMWARL